MDMYEAINAAADNSVAYHQLKKELRELRQTPGRLTPADQAWYARNILEAADLVERGYMRLAQDTETREWIAWQPGDPVCVMAHDSVDAVLAAWRCRALWFAIAGADDPPQMAEEALVRAMEAMVIDEGVAVHSGLDGWIAEDQERRLREQIQAAMRFGF